MRIASVLHDPSLEPDGAPLLPTLALERDGALYRVGELARVFGPRFAALARDVDFHEAVIGRCCEGLRELDERLRSGERPSSARILPAGRTWLAPCDTERAALVVATWDPVGGEGGEEGGDPSFPAFRVGSARTFLGHDAAVPLANPRANLKVEASLAAVLGDEVSRATCAEAERAVLGYTVLLSYPPGFEAQLGPVLVTKDEAHNLEGLLRTQLRVNGAVVETGDAAEARFSPAEVIAWISHAFPLAAGDVVAVRRLREASPSDIAAPFAEGTRVDFTIERLGRLSGRLVSAPLARAWRKAPC